MCRRACFIVLVTLAFAASRNLAPAVDDDPLTRAQALLKETKSITIDPLALETIGKVNRVRSEAEKKVVGTWRLGSDTKYILNDDYSGVWESDGKKYADLFWSMSGDVVTVTTADRKVTWMYKSYGGKSMSLISDNKFVSITIEKD